MTGRDAPPVPFVDLPWQHEQIAPEIMPRLAEVMSSGSFIQGPDVKAFESDFARFCGTEYCVGVGNGTDALELALRAAQVPPGSKVILPTNTFIATAEAVVRAGAQPVFVDCDERALVDVRQVAERIDSDTSAVMPVHLYGQIAEMETLAEAVAGREILVIEDAAQAQGASRWSRGIGSWGIAAATSFYPGKNLGAYGDGGAVMTNDEAVAEAVRRLADHGSRVKYVHSDVGCNSRLDTLQAVVLGAKLRRLEDWNARRREAAALYAEMFASLQQEGLLKPVPVAEGNIPVWHLFVIRVDRRDDVLAELHRSGIGAGIHYPVPVHLSDAFRYLGYGPGDFPVAEAMSAEILSLPIFPGITESTVERVAEVVTAAVRSTP
jgi:dTDP-4-amino-4,6-dideoxygalactose transaminase